MERASGEKRSADPSIRVDSQPKRPRVDTAEASSSVPDSTRQPVFKTPGPTASAFGASWEGRPLSKGKQPKLKGKKLGAKDAKIRRFKLFKLKVHKLLSHLVASREPLHPDLELGGVGQIEEVVEKLIDDYGLSAKQRP